MGIFENIKDSIKTAIVSWLQIQPAHDHSIILHEQLNFHQTVARNRILYRGDPSELDQFFKNTSKDAVSAARFWASSPSKGQRIRKIHSGLPSMIVDVLAKVAINDMLDVKFATAGHLEPTWREIAEENGIRELLKGALQDVLAVGDGAFKISYDPDISELPLIEFYSGEHVQYSYKRGRVTEVIFMTPYEGNDKKKTKYVLLEKYGQDSIEYELQTTDGKIVELTELEETADLQPVTFDTEKRMMAVPLMIHKSPKWPGRGRSILDAKIDSFDALDETISQWQDALRAGRIKRYIPDTMLPTNPETGQTMSPNPFDHQFIKIKESKEEGGKSTGIHTDQPKLDYDGFIGTYINNLDLCLQGIISPSTLGIDTKKLDNAEAQREKEKTTLYSRDEILDVVRKVIPELVQAALDMWANLNKTTPEKIECTVEFGEYANPSFEAQVETVGKAASGQIMSIEAQVDTLWGDTKDEKWKKEEVMRIKQEKGVAIVDDPSMLPNGFAEEGELDGVDRVDSPDARRDGDLSVPVDEEESEEASGVGRGRGLQVDSMASTSDAKPEQDEESVQELDQRDVSKTKPRGRKANK